MGQHHAPYYLHCSQITKKMIHNFESPFVAWYPVKNHQQLKRKYLSTIHQHRDEIKDLPEAYSDYGHSSYKERFAENNPLVQSELIKSIVWEPFDYLLQEKQFSINPKKSHLKDIWWNYYYPNSFARPHRHYNSDFSGIYILKLDEPNTTEFARITDEGPSELMHTKFSTEEISEGNVMIFPSQLLHYAHPCRKNRVVIVWNIICEW
jgi:hypothetical protein